ncbi:hypothetical protein SAMN05421766_103546 [Zobellia uliginosa]|uniref:Lipoprotein n=1 Tax=Zobellia uliginosa TaxID=143224 RepID=A0ABY1KW83_9FLAO|nr:hypothetical protein [Zobellia uliginosa]SIS71188.1 hypothetical protein SAMN05421766_103546 [Zobellia uliginosa]
MRKTHILFVMTLFLLASCKTETKNPPEAVIDSPTSTSASASTGNLDVTITTADGAVLGGFDLSPIKILANNTNYTFKSKPDKHKFYANGRMKYEVKFKEESLKLRDEDSELLWKVKIYPDKVKISDNEENENAFEVRPYDDKIKIKRDGEELYRVNLEGNIVKVNDKEAYQLSSAQENYVYAILAIEEIPTDHKLFIIAELLNKI